MKQCILRITGIAMITGSFVAVALAQDNAAIAAAAGDKYVISAKAGGVNFVEGSVGIVRQSGRSGRLLKGDNLEMGDRVSTDNDGKAEILLNPGSYLRVGGNSAFEFNTTSLDDLKIRLDSGSAIFEVFATEDFTVTVNTPKSKYVLIDSGIYRVDVSSDGSGKIAVWKGKAQIGDDTEATVKSGREASVIGANVTLAKFDRDERDGFDLWSKDRAKDLAKISGTLARNTMRTALMRSFMGSRWNMYDSFGLWVFDPFSRSHCFLPFGYGWNSPYGYGFGHSIWYYNLPPVVFQPPTHSGGNGSGGGPTRNVRTSKIRATPVFVQAQGTSGSTGRSIRTVKSGGNNGDIRSAPIRPSAPVFIPSPPTRTVRTSKGNN